MIIFKNANFRIDFRERIGRDVLETALTITSDKIASFSDLIKERQTDFAVHCRVSYGPHKAKGKSRGTM